MAFLSKNFSPLGANSKRGAVPQHFSYSTADAIAVVTAAGYFDSIAKSLNVGDIITTVIVDNPDAPTAQTDYKNVYIQAIDLVAANKVTAKVASVI